MRILGCRFSDEDGSMIVEWYDESEQKAEGGVMYQTIVTVEAMSNWKHVGYYAAEVLEDLEELVSWTTKYHNGTYND